MPELPLTLVGLTGTGAATYVAKKALERNSPQVDTPAKPPATPHAVLHIRGKNLLKPQVPVEQLSRYVTLDRAGVTAVDWVGETLIDATLDRDPAASAKVAVTTAAGATAEGTVAA